MSALRRRSALVLSSSLLFGWVACTTNTTIVQQQATGGADTGSGNAGAAGESGNTGGASSSGGGTDGSAGAGGNASSGGTESSGGTANTGGAANTGGSGEGGGPACEQIGSCSCFRVAILGQQGTFGAVPGQAGTSAIAKWLNENSTASAELFHEKPTLDADFLADFDVLILEDPRSEEDGPTWTYSADEIDAVEAWVRDGKHGVIALSGYSADSGEVDPTNALLAFSGMQYVKGSDTLGSPSGSCAYCLGNSVEQDEWAAHPIAANVNAVGAFHGRAITKGTAQTVSTDGSTVLGAAAQVDEGRVFLFHDEWVSYVSQWNGAGLNDDCRELSDVHMCKGIHPSLTYQAAQLWYNALSWVSGAPACFDIEDASIIK